ncbi:hypothetical protein QCA50_011165 [Cerrena zonata]|uniref:2OGFeDO JBP1/TET oxygenase domain-containing protein n=1 Tax=Cerrena zonata TaxID=2478898 RepID=A0AAW0G3D0_9APHY
MPSDQAQFDKLHATTSYMLSLFTHMLASQTMKTSDGYPPKPDHLSPEMDGECTVIIDRMVRAFLDPVTVPWDYHKYVYECTRRCLGGGMGQKERKLAQTFKRWRDDLTTIVSPQTVVDNQGRIIVWALPDLLSPRIQNILEEGTKLQREFLEAELAKGHEGDSWRWNKSLFRKGAPGDINGVLNFSPAWFMLGHQGKASGLKTSPFLTTSAGELWMKNFFDAGSIISGILRIMHPDQYRMQWETVQVLRHDSRFTAIFDVWPSIFAAISVIANRQAPLHRDPNGNYYWYDILVSVGRYTTAYLCLEPIGFQIRNRPGTVVGFSGKGIRHGVAEADGQRYCHAFYLRTDVQQYCNVRGAGCMTQEVFRRWVGSIGAEKLTNIARDPFFL